MSQARLLDIDELRDQVSMEHVLGRLGFLDPLQGSGPQRRGPCLLYDAQRDNGRLPRGCRDKLRFRAL